MSTDDITAWALRKADEIVRHHREAGLSTEAASRLRDAIAEALIEAYGLGQEPIGDD